MHIPKTRVVLTPPPCTSYTSHAPETIMSYAPPLHTQPTPSPHRVLLAQHTTDPPNLLLLLRELLVCRTPRETSRLARERVACPISASVCRYASILRACRETLLFDHARHPVSSHLLIGLSHPSAGGKFAAAVQGIARRSDHASFCFFSLFFCLIVSVGVSGIG